MKKGFAGALAFLALALASAGLAAASYSDPAGDDNAAPDITAVTVAAASPEAVTITVTIANYPSLSGNTWLNLWFDVDANRDTGVVGFDALVRYLASGAVEYLTWNGSNLVPQPTTGVAGTYDAGALTMSVPKTVLGSGPTFGILVVSGRRQQLGAGAFIASDFAPNSGSHSWDGAGETAFADPVSDHEAAPDVTSVRVSDARDGWIRFAITTPNSETLGGQTIVALEIDTDNRAATGQNGAEIVIPNIGGEVQLQRWNPAARRWEEDVAPTLVRARSADHVVTMEVHRSELANPQRFGFRLTSAIFDPSSGTPFGVDLAPDNGSFWRYTMVNRVVRLLAGKATGAPAVPRAGRSFTIGVPVRRSDTNRAVTSARVACNVLGDGKRVRATGRVRAGRAECTMVAPRAGTRITGSITVRSVGASITVRFRFRVH